ncbi:ATP-binding protein [Desulfovibrio cuneatus]|uniref:ATP-binding protein n=1 Tax=Desulfovibrio cuneatus TaxID=159728 RepID=UPI00040E3422|nr:ATP-binding protein [Desulfovibrio cuneatus]
MSESILEFDKSDFLGKVAMVDTNRVVAAIENHDMMTSISVGSLVAIQGRLNSEFLIGIIERATRSTTERLLTNEVDDEGNIPFGEALQDFIKIVLIGTYRTVDGDRSNTFKRGADTFPQIDRACYQLSAHNLQSFMNLLSAKVPLGERMALGHYMADQTAVAIAHGDKFFQRHAAILGSTGSGKSWAVALILERAAKLTHPNLIVLDMHGEYSTLCEGKEAIAEQFKIAGPGDCLSESTNSLFLPYWLLNREEMLAMILDRSDQNAPNQASRFTEHVRKLKESTLKDLNKQDVLDTFTVDSPIYYDISQLMALLNIDDEGTKPGKTGPVKGDWNGKLTRFIARLEAKIEDRRYGFLFQPPKSTSEYEWLSKIAMRLFHSGKTTKGIKIIDFSEVPADVLPIVAGVLARLLYNVQFWMNDNDRHPLTIVCDEAHLYLPVRDEADAPEKRALESFERIAKEGRKYGVSLLVVSQRPSDVSRTILSQCNNFLVLRLTNDQDQSVVKRMVPESMSGLTDILPLLDTGEGLLLGDSILLPTRIKLDCPKIEPASATRQFWTEWANRTPNEKAVEKAIETMRRQTR